MQDWNRRHIQSPEFAGSCSTTWSFCRQSCTVLLLSAMGHYSSSVGFISHFIACVWFWLIFLSLSLVFSFIKPLCMAEKEKKKSKQSCTQSRVSCFLAWCSILIFLPFLWRLAASLLQWSWEWEGEQGLFPCLHSFCVPVLFHELQPRASKQIVVTSKQRWKPPSFLPSRVLLGAEGDLGSLHIGLCS